MGSSELALLGITILSPLALFTLIFGINYLKNKEKMAMIERGIDMRTDLPKPRQSNPALSLTFGLLLIGSGLGLFIAYMMDYFVLSNNGHRFVSPAIYFSLISVFGGLGLFIAYLIERKANQKKEL